MSNPIFGTRIVENRSIYVERDTVYDIRPDSLKCPNCGCSGCEYVDVTRDHALTLGCMVFKCQVCILDFAVWIPIHRKNS